jgi:hypothetical protein
MSEFMKTTNDRTGIPAKGWILNGVEYIMPETTDDYASCEWCGNERIRYVHHLSHPDHFEELAVGCVCSGKLTGDLLAAKGAEKLTRSRSKRREAFPDRAWKTTRYGGLSITINGQRVTVARKSETYRIWINGRKGSRTYCTSRAAMLAAFDYLTPALTK